MKFLTLFLTFSLLNISYAKPESFRKSKKILSKIYKELDSKTFYCDCEYKGKKVNKKSCGYKGKLKKNGTEYFKKRSEKIEWEHVFPVSKAIGAFPECVIKGKKLSRKKCLKVSKGFRKLEADLHNLVPAVGSLNAFRSNLSYSGMPVSKKEWGQCVFQKEGRKISIKDDIKGDIARIYFYLNMKYPQVGVISNKNKKLFQAWDKLDKVSEKECKLNKLKTKYQKDDNPFISKHCN